MKAILLKAWVIIVCLYIVVCVLLYFFQEKIIFHPTKLDKDYKFSFDHPPEEINVTNVAKSLRWMVPFVTINMKENSEQFNQFVAGLLQRMQSTKDRLT